ncbi:hypothetical protein BVY04_04415 [bacterium M21]|nr:hypothetical protein BVY04_04415 [bacterium M21]
MYIAAFMLRLDGSIDANTWQMIGQTTPILCVVTMLVFAAYKLHSGLWSYFSVDDLLKVGYAAITTTVIFGFILFAMNHWSFDGFPRSVLILSMMLLGAWASIGRLIVRYFCEYKVRSEAFVDRDYVDRILIVGNLEQGDLILRCARTNKMGKFVGVVSDNESDHEMRIHGVPVTYCKLSDVGEVAKSLDATCVLILPPFNGPRKMNRIVESCSVAAVACQFRQVPSLTELASGEISVSNIKDVDIEDLLGRGERRIDRTQVHESLTGKNILVTGAGGSIGSELCRQIAQYSPEILVLFEISEIALYTIEKDIRARYPNLKVVAFAGDIRHPEEVETAIEVAGGIDTIYHAAAYKHVPLMEKNVPACFRNNVIGTHRLSEVAQLCKVKRFVMISSDKAVRPSNIMGATKRIAERAIGEREPNGTVFVAVRFGNVLGSSGSVIPLFKKQIAAGGPVTVTSPDIRRFFMTIPEAVELVMQAGAIGRRGEVMVLEMGEETKIVDLAKRLIELSGFVAGKDIKIEFSGLRPGEKEYEEIMTEDENIVKTPHDKIWVMKKNGDQKRLPKVEIERIEYLITTNDEVGLRHLAEEYVPENTFKSKDPQRPEFRPEKTRELVRTSMGMLIDRAEQLCDPSVIKPEVRSG